MGDTELGQTPDMALEALQMILQWIPGSRFQVFRAAFLYVPIHLVSSSKKLDLSSSHLKGP